MLLGAGVPVAESVLRPMLIDPANLEETIQRIGANRGLFVASILAYVTAFVADVLVAWGCTPCSPRSVERCPCSPVGSGCSMRPSHWEVTVAQGRLHRAA